MKYNDFVVINKGFYEGCTGHIKGKFMYTYCVQLEDLTNVWVYPWFLQKIQ